MRVKRAGNAGAASLRASAASEVGAERLAFKHFERQSKS